MPWPSTSISNRQASNASPDALAHSQRGNGRNAWRVVAATPTRKVSHAIFHPVEVKALPEYRLWIRYADGFEGEVDLSHLAGRGVFSLWNDTSAFEQVHVAEDGAIRWTDDVELCPDATYLKLTGTLPEDVFPNATPATHA